MGDSTPNCETLSYGELFVGLGLSERKLRRLDRGIERVARTLGGILSHWTLIISIMLALYFVVGKSSSPELLWKDASA